METGTGMRTGTRTGLGSAEERRRSTKNVSRALDAMHVYSARIINSADNGWRLRSPDSSVRKAPVSVHAHRTEGVTRPKGRVETNRLGDRIEVGGENGDGNKVGGRNRDVNGKGGGDGAGTRTGV